jgi:hypothetical protein
MAVPNTTFYYYVGYAANNHVVQKHGNSSLIKPQAHTMQATSTLRCILNKSANPIPHRSCTLAFGEKVVSKVLLATWKWKESTLSLIQSIVPLDHKKSRCQT